MPWETFRDYWRCCGGYEPAEEAYPAAIEDATIQAALARAVLYYVRDGMEAPAAEIRAEGELGLESGTIKGKILTP